jgi:TPR repeat protein
LHLAFALTTISKETDEVKIAEVYSSGAAMGHPDSMVRLADLYLSGKGVPVNRQNALQLLQTAAQLRHIGAVHKLCAAYETDNDLESAFIWHLRGAEMGDANSMFGAAFAYSTGAGVEINPQQAALWHQRGAALGHADSMFCLAVDYENGNGLNLVSFLFAFHSFC